MLAQGKLPATVGTGDAAAQTLQAWVEPAGPKALTVMELSEDLDSLTKNAAAVGKMADKQAGGSTGGGRKKKHSKDNMLQVDEVMALVLGSLLESQDSQ